MIAEDIARTVKHAAIGFGLLVLMGLAASYCAARRVESAQHQAQQTAERDTMRARGRRDKVKAREEHVARNAEKARGDSLLRIAQRSDSIATAARARLLARGPVDTNDIVALRQRVRAQDSVIVAQAQALADARLVAPAYLGALDHGEQATLLALSSADDFERADTLSQTIGAQRERDAHRRGVAQGIKGTLAVITVVVVTGAAWSIAKVRR